MKIQQSKAVSAFGGINFVFDFLERSQINALIEKSFPALASQSEYSWKDLINSMLSIYLCGGDCIEDLQTHLRSHFKANPFIKMPSPDTVLRRLKGLAVENLQCNTKRGLVTHTYNLNEFTNQLNVSLLKQQGVCDAQELTLDYDNTIIFNEKSDSKMTYKRNPGYQPGVGYLNEEHVFFVENRNGNSDAKAFQADTLKRMFELLKQNGIKKAKHFRADAASYQYDVVKLVEQNVENFYIGCRNSYIAKYFSQVEEWEQTIDSTNEPMQVGSIIIEPFGNQCKKDGVEAKPYRLVVKRKLREDAQMDLFTNDAYEYWAILTNNMEMTAVEVAHFYNHRGKPERQFDILKNDWGWNHMCFSTLENNTVFLGLTAFLKNVYVFIIQHFSKLTDALKPTFRVKKFLFRFIVLPAIWIKRSRQLILKIFTDSDRYTTLSLNTT